MEQQDRDYARHVGKTSDEIVVFSIRRESQCGQCEAELMPGDWLTLRENQALCLKCAGLSHLEFLPSGDPALTRRASKLSSLRAVVVRWARARKRYERQGTLVEPAAIAAAREQCAADVAKRQAKNARAAMKRAAADQVYQAAFLTELRQRFAGCPAKEAEEIAKHACEKYSGRVGRSAGAKQLEEDKIRLAVIAHVRHTHTGYDDLLINNVERREARRLIEAKVQRVLASWEKSPAF